MGVGANTVVFAMTLASFASGCASQDIPQAYRGRRFDRIDPLGAYPAKTGFTGPVLDPGNYATTAYSEIHKVECATTTVREPASARTKDGIEVRVKVYVTFAADCTDYGVEAVLSAQPVDQSNSVRAARLYETYVQPAVGEALRQVVSPLRATEAGERRDEILADVTKRLLGMVAQRAHHIVVMRGVSVSDLVFPPDVQKATTELAVQAILRDKAVAERDRVAAEIETAEMRLEQRAGAVPTAGAPAKAAEPAAAAPTPTAVSGDAPAPQATPEDNPYDPYE